MRIISLGEEEEERLRHAYFKDKLFATLYAPLKVLRPEYTQHTPTELWHTALGFTERVLVCEEPEELEDEIESCQFMAGEGNDAFLLLFISMYHLAALRKRSAAATDILVAIKRRIQGHMLYAPLFAAVSSKENQRIVRGIGVDIENYRLHDTPSGNAADEKMEEKAVGGKEVVGELVSIAIGHGNTEICDRAEFLLRRLDDRYDHVFKSEIDRLAHASDKTNREACEPRVKAENYHRYESGAKHDDHSHQLYIKPTSAAEIDKNQLKIAQQ